MVHRFCIPLFAFLTMFFGGCTVGGLPSDFFIGFDGGYITYPDARNPHPCDEELMSIDFYNCGACDHTCQGVGDRCEGGECRCGTTPACEDVNTQECRFGSCISSDVTGRVCEFDSWCASGFGCVRGYCTRLECVPEVCDNVDNDCDGEVDGDARGPVARWCYDQNVSAETTLSTPCVRGVQVCSVGNWQECLGAISPVEEIGLLACDGIDNNCDGCLDGILTSEGCQSINPGGFDIVYAIDTSGSMADKIEAVRDATVSFSAVYGADPSFRFSLVLVPGLTDGEATVLIPLSPFATFSSVLSSTDLTSTATSSEPSWDVVYELGTNELAVNWSDGTVRIIILFTDEQGQSFRFPRRITEPEMCRGLTHGEFLAYVVLPGDMGDWDLCGEYFELTPDPETMATALQRIIRDPCLD